MDKDLMTTGKGLMQTEDSEYVRLVSLISGVWDKAKNDAALAVNTELLDASWETGRYIVEFEQGGKAKARYGEQLITNLAKDLTRMRGKGFSRSNLIYMRKFYLTFPKSETLSHQLTWSHYFELLKCDDPLEMQFYMKECIRMEGERVETPNQFIVVSATCLEYRQGWGIGSCKENARDWYLFHLLYNCKILAKRFGIIRKSTYFCSTNESCI